MRVRITPKSAIRVFIVGLLTSQGRPPGELFPESESEFFLKDRDAQVIFMRNRKGEVTHAILRINGVDIRAPRRK